MKKIGILTLDGIVNYGNRLQNYAMQTILQQENCSVDTIVAKGELLKILYRSIRTIIRDKKRALNFIKFNRKYISIKRIYAKKWMIDSRIARNYDYFVVGSDQVWNPNIRKKERYNFFLRFAKPQQRVAVSASFSVNSLDSKYIEEYKKGLSEFSAVSVREFEGAEIVKNICNRNVEVLCDPTLTLEREEWDKIACKPKCEIPEKYMLVYFLGRILDERHRDLESYAKANNLEIIFLNNKNNMELYNCGPSEFVWLIKHATVVCTDSFHGTAFSAIYNIPFWAFSREENNTIAQNMESRIVSMCKKLSIEGRLIDKLTENMSVEYDFTLVNESIAAEKKKFVEFLKESFKPHED